MNKRTFILGILLIILGIASLFLFDTKGKIKSLFNKEEKQINKIDEIMNNMTIDQKIAQMLILYYNDTVVDENLKNTIQTLSPGGFIIMDENITDLETTKKFIQDIKDNSKIIPFIATDQEGGTVQRLYKLDDITFSDIPSMFEVGKTDDETLAYNIGKVISEELETVGININFAPTIDIFSNPKNKIIGTRSFGTDAVLVSKMALSLAKGLEDNNIIACYKHFPGHGDTLEDSHTQLPIINKTLNELKDLELKPFKDAIDNGAKMIMIGHLALPNITNDNTPATMSKEIVTDLLKNEMGYKGLVITDALNMGALTNNYTDEEIYTKVVEAGVDILLMPSSSKKAIEIIKKNISEERINESVKKIIEFKLNYLKDYTLLDSTYIYNQEHKDIINKVK